MKNPLFREMSAAELLERYAAGERNFAGIRVSVWKRELEGVILKNSNFCGAVLHASLAGTNLTGCYFNGAELAEVNLSNAILRKVRLDGATLAQSVLSGADLTHACLVRAELDEAVMKNTNLCGANLVGASGIDIEYWLEIGCIFCRTTMPDGSERNDGCRRLGIHITSTDSESAIKKLDGEVIVGSLLIIHR
jgi:uncharacterized protein YjbI with pentapeptide repeats